MAYRRMVYMGIAFIFTSYMVIARIGIAFHFGAHFYTAINVHFLKRHSAPKGALMSKRLSLVQNACLQ